MKRSDSVAFVGLLCVYLAISLHHLDTVPMVYEDEPWESSTGWKLANEGVFGSDMFEGWHGMEHHCYAFMPLHPMMLALFFRMLGLGVAQARVETVFVGLAVLVGTFYLGRRLFGPPVGLLSLLFLLCVRLTGTNPSSVSGILFLDMARIARYDMFVPALGIAALHSWLSARDSGRWWSFVGTGFLIGLSALGHLYGVFWVPVIGVLTIWERGVRASLLPLLWMMLGFLVPWLPYMAYVSADIESWVGQTNEYFLEGRFNVLDPLWYLDNLVLEPDRYKVGLRSATPLAMVGRIGLWCTLIILPASIVGLIRSGDRSARVVWVSAVLLPLCFALTIHIKMMNYIVTFMPLWALAIAWGLLFLWERLGYWGRRGVAMIGAMVLIEGLNQIFVLETATITPYDFFIDQVRAEIPEGARVLGLPNYWYGMENVDYHSFVVPAYLAVSEPPVPFDVGIENIHPDIVLIDDRMRFVFEHPTLEHGNLAGGFAQWRERHGLERYAVVVDATYGRMELWRTQR